mgnify:CR=1 FL=1
MHLRQFQQSAKRQEKISDAGLHTMMGWIACIIFMELL